MDIYLYIYIGKCDLNMERNDSTWIRKIIEFGWESNTCIQKDSNTVENC